MITTDEILRFCEEFEVPFEEVAEYILERESEGETEAPKSASPKPAPKKRKGLKGKPNRIVKPDYDRDLAKQDVVGELNVKDISIPFPNFKEYQPKIAAFAMQNADNMGAVLVFCIATQLAAWDVVYHGFPALMNHLRQKKDHLGNLKPGLKPYPKDAPFKMLVFSGAASIDLVWKNRHRLYAGIMHAIEQDNRLHGTGFLVYQRMLAVPGLGIPKAGFATQLVIGKFGCMDSINLKMLGAPKKLLAGNSGEFKTMKNYLKMPKTGSPEQDASYADLSQDAVGLMPNGVKAMMSYLHGEWSKGGTQIAQMYVDYLDELKKEAHEKTSEHLWDVWCEIVAHRIWHAATPEPNLLVHQTGSEPHILPAYPFRKTIPAARKSLEPFGTPDEKGIITPRGMGRGVGSQHLDMISASQDAKDVVNSLVG